MFVSTASTEAARHGNARRFTCLDVAKAAGLEPGRKSGPELVYHCANPEHEDVPPSMRIHPIKDTFHCDSCGKGGTAWDLLALIGRADPRDKPAMYQLRLSYGLASNGNESLNGNRKPVTWLGHPIKSWYPYCDAAGALLYEIARVEYTQGPDRKKEFPVFCRGSWGLKDKDVEQVLYRLPEVLTATDIILVEGEKDVDNLHE